MLALIGQLLNFALALLFWLIVGRLVLAAMIGDRPNFIMATLRRGTDPVLGLVRRLTPSFVSDRYVPLISLLLLLLLRPVLLPLLLSGQ